MADTPRPDDDEPPPEPLKPTVRVPRGESRAEVWARWAGVVSYSVAVLTALVLRLRDLGIKPLHNDEGVNGWFLLRLIEEGRYAYDPTNYHGPFLYYFGWLPLLADPRSPVLLRLPQAVTGAACLLLLIPLRRRLGWLGVAASAWLFALGPMQVYFARHAIHEIYMVFFTLASVVVFERYTSRHGEWFDEERPRPGADWGQRTWLLCLGVLALALIYANKETGIITYAALGCGLGFAGLCALLTRGRSLNALEDLRRAPRDVLDFVRAELGRGECWWAEALFAVTTGLALVLASLLAGVGLRVAIYGDKSGNAWDIWQQTPAWLCEGPGWKAWAVGVAGVLAAGALLLGPPGRLVRQWLAAQPLPRRGWLIALTLALGVHVLLFTSLFSHPKGLVDWALSLYYWVQRGVAHVKTGHEGKPKLYYLTLMWRFEAPLLVLAGLGWVASLVRGRLFALFTMGWGIAIVVAYSLIEYKTPWLVINLTLPLIVSAGVGVTALAELPAYLARRLDRPAWEGRGRGALALVLALALPALACAPNPAPPAKAPLSQVGPWWELLWDVNYVHPDDNDYPIVYGQTVHAFVDLVERVKPLLERGERMSVLSPDYWPLPYYVHGLSVGYPKDAPDAGARLVLIRPYQQAKLDPKYRSWRRQDYDLRPNVPVRLLIDPSLTTTP